MRHSLGPTVKRMFSSRSRTKRLSGSATLNRPSFPGTTAIIRIDISTTGLIRGQAMVVARHPDGVYECLYRTRHAERIEPARLAIIAAYRQGLVSGQTGWPTRASKPLFSVSATDGEFAVSLVNLVLYTSPSRIDADLVLTACRRACSIAALQVANRSTR